MSLEIKSLFDFLTPTEISDVTSGSPTIDIAPKISNWLAWCQANKNMGFIPNCYCLIGYKIIQPANVSVDSDPLAHLKWININNCGWIVEGSGVVDPGHFKCYLPHMEGPNNFSGYYSNPKVYSLASYAGIGLTIQNAIWGDIFVSYSIGWGEAIKVTSTGQSCDNHFVKMGTIDLCSVGIHLSAPVGSTGAVGQVQFETLNIFAFCPIRITGQSAGVFDSQFNVLSAFVNEAGGCPLYVDGSIITDCRVSIGKAQNGYFPDSPSTTPSTYVGPLVGGSGTIGSEADLAIGTRLCVDIGSTADRTFIAGNPIALKLRGIDSHVAIACPPYAGLAAVALSNTAGEANYNGGLGGASVFKTNYVQIQVTSLAPGAYQTFYFYHQRLNPESLVPIKVISPQNSLNGLELVAISLPTTAAPREAKILAINNSSSAMTKTVNFFIELD